MKILGPAELFPCLCPPQPPQRDGVTQYRPLSFPGSPGSSVPPHIQNPEVTTTNEDKEDLPLGTTEAAVRSCVRLISAVTCQPEKLCAYYLDLYYQVRRAYERENEELKAPPLTLEAAWPRLRELMEETLRSTAEDQARAILDGMGLHPAPPPDYPAPPRMMNTPETPESSPETPAIMSEEERRARRAEIKRKRRENLQKATEASKRVDRSGDKNGAAIAKKAKIVIRERLLEARKNGLTNPQLLKESEGQFTEDDLWRIVQGHVVGIATYREVNAALDRIESKASISA